MMAFPEQDVLMEVPEPRSGLDWMSKKELKDILNARVRYPTLWLKNPETKYLNIRLDNRTGHALIWTQAFNSIKQAEFMRERKELCDKLLATNLAVAKEAAELLKSLAVEEMSFEAKKFWRINPNWVDPNPPAAA